MERRNLLNVVEAGYAVDAGRTPWLTRVVEAARPALDQGLGVVGYSFDAADSELIRLGRPVFDGCAQTVWDAMLHASQSIGPAAVRRTYLGTRPFGTVAQRFEGTSREVFLQLARKCYQPRGIADLLVVHVLDEGRRGCVIATPVRKSYLACRKDKVLWSRVVSHLRLGHRLHVRLPAHSRASCEQLGEAVLTPEGKVEHAEGPARDAPARDALRRAALAMDRARTLRMSSEPELALSLWSGLISGRWSLIDRFDSDGRRYIVAHRNDSHPVRPRGMTLREQQVVTLVLRGRSSKFIAYELEIAESTVSEHLSIALEKLGLRSHNELMQLAALERGRRSTND